MSHSATLCFPRRLISLGLLLLMTQTAPAAAIETAAREALIVDTTTGAVLFERDSDVPMPPASMSKIMTIYLVFEALKDGRLTLDEKLPVSEKAWRMGGSKMFVAVNDEIRVEDLLRGVIVQSGNDACIVLAEGLAGSEEAFAGLMNDKARELGLDGSSFVNATGWPHPDQRMTARDLATLAQKTIENFPEYYGYYSETTFTWTDIRQGNRNPLLYKNMGADGLKTGHTEEAGYGLTGSATRKDRRLILVINGLNSMKQRSSESQKLLTWAFREFDNYALFKAGEQVEEAEVWLGESASVPLVLDQDVVVTLPRKARRKLSVSVRYDGPVPAPVAAGDQIATLVVTAPETEPVEVPLFAGAEVPKLGPFGRFTASLRQLILGAQ
ncbi:MAG: D-alanyl-D-alanine carboxypeptidase family protein [Kiloniellales bacterium]|nr:D-alanyl-D-alanine carboxypeptidase family protein [Kiloniellales bacterium]